MKGFLVVVVWLASSAAAVSAPSLKDRLGEASACSDASLQEFASRTCDPPEQIAARAVARCQAQWNSVADLAIGPALVGASPGALREHARSRKT